MENLQIFKELWMPNKKLIIESQLGINFSSEQFEKKLFEIKDSLLNHTLLLSKKEFTSIELAEVNKIVTDFLRSKRK